MFQSRNTRFCISYAWLISKIMFNETLKYFCIFGNTRPASWVMHLTSFLHVIPVRNIVPFSNIVNMSNISCLFWVERILLAVYSLTFLQKIKGTQNEGRYQSIYLQKICRCKMKEDIKVFIKRFAEAAACRCSPKKVKVF